MKQSLTKPGDCSSHRKINKKNKNVHFEINKLKKHTYPSNNVISLIYVIIAGIYYLLNALWPRNRRASWLWNKNKLVNKSLEHGDAWVKQSANTDMNFCFSSFPENTTVSWTEQMDGCSSSSTGRDKRGAWVRSCSAVRLTRLYTQSTAGSVCGTGSTPDPDWAFWLSGFYKSWGEEISPSFQLQWSRAGGLDGSVGPPLLGRLSPGCRRTTGCRTESRSETRGSPGPGGGSGTAPPPAAPWAAPARPPGSSPGRWGSAFSPCGSAPTGPARAGFPGPPSDWRRGRRPSRSEGWKHFRSLMWCLQVHGNGSDKALICQVLIIKETLVLQSARCVLKRPSLWHDSFMPGLQPFH